MGQDSIKFCVVVKQNIGEKGGKSVRQLPLSLKSFLGGVEEKTTLDLI